MAQPAPIRFNVPRVEGDELEHVRRSAESGRTSADGPYSRRVEDLIRNEIGSSKVLLTTSCTAALELAAMLLDVGPGDSVVVPSFGFATIASAFARAGARIRFCDIEPRTLGLDPEHLETLLDDSVRAVVPIHYAGIGCRISEIESLVSAHPRAQLIEDNAHGLFGAVGGRSLGSFGRFGAVSFHETKNLSCGEGGALLLTDPDDVDRAEVLFHKGTDRKAFLAGDVDRYTWQAVGSSFGLSDILAAHLWGQLEQRHAIRARRREVFERYHAALVPRADELGLELPVVPEGSEPAHHAYAIRVADARSRDPLLAGLRSDGIEAAFHYVPLHRSPAGLEVSDPAAPPDCPVTEDIAARLIRLPFHTSLTDADIDRVIEGLVARVAASGS